MMRLLLHGPAKAASRKTLIEFKNKFDPNNVVILEEGADLKTIQEGLVAQSLFSEQQLIIVENPTEFTCPASSQLSIILWFDKEVDIKKWPGFKPEFFPEAKEISVFPFLDLLAAGSPKAFLEMQKLKNNGFDIFYLLTMVFYFLRSLTVTPQKASDFVRKKLERQRAGFDRQKITSLYKEMLEIDFKIKSGLLEKEQAEFLLVNEFTSK